MDEMRMRYLEEFYNVRDYGDFYNRYKLLIYNYISIDKFINHNDLYCICRIVYLYILQELL